MSTTHHVAESLAALCDPEAAIEIRAIQEGRPPSWERFPPGTPVETIADLAAEWNDAGWNVYVALNPIDPGTPPGQSARDQDITRRRWLLVDVDPVRQADTSSTGDEKLQAKIVARQIVAHLESDGWPSPLIGDSGNGWHLLYRIDLPNTDDAKATANGVLKSLAKRFDSEAVKIDTKVGNASRITCAYGTWKRKGPNSDERPHRQSALRGESPPGIVPADLLAKLGAEQAQPPQPTNGRTVSQTADGRMARARDYLAKIDPAIAGRNGHAALFRAACKLVEFGLNEQETFELLASDYNPRCVPPWSDKELFHKVKDAFQANGRNAGCKLLEGPPPRSSPPGTPPEPLVWSGPPRPVRDELPPVPSMRPDMLPEPLGAWLEDAAERIGCELDYLAVGAVVSMAIVVGRKVAIRPKRFDDWSVIPNLWGCLVGRPSLLKSPAMTEAFGPLAKLAKDADARHEAELARHKADALLADAQADAAKAMLKVAARKGQPIQEQERLAVAAVGAEPPDEPSPRRFTTNSATVEALGELLKANPNGVGVIRDELIGLFREHERPGREGDRQFFLEAWNGSGSFDCDRIGRGRIHTSGMCLSVFGGIQPGPLAKLVKDAADGRQGDDGLLPRFQLIVWPDFAAEWRVVDREPDHAARDRAYDLYERLDAMTASTVGAAIGPKDGRDSVPYLRFDPAAQQRFFNWWEKLEAKVRSPDVFPMIESHLSKYRSLFPSLAVLFHLANVIDGEPPGPVSDRAAAMAEAWCDYLEKHAARVYAAATQPDMAAARDLGDKVRAGVLPDPFALRDVYRKCWSGLATPDEARRAVAVLEELGWFQTVDVSGTGGKPREEIHIHPSLPRKGGKTAPTPLGGTDITDITDKSPPPAAPADPFVSNVSPFSGAVSEKTTADGAHAPGRRRVRL